VAFFPDQASFTLQASAGALFEKVKQPKRFVKKNDQKTMSDEPFSFCPFARTPLPISY
jgi:hypothetical protein